MNDLPKISKVNGEEGDCSEEMPQFVDVEGFTGVALADSHTWRFKESFIAKLEVIKCKKCGRESISWERVHEAA